MTNGSDGFNLTVTISTDELGTMRRRIAFLEATLVQVLRGQRALREWFTAAELEHLRLPGLPASRGAITRQARKQGWKVRTTGEGNEYHFSTLPRHAFAALIDRVIAPAATSEESGRPVPAIAPPPPMPPPAPADTTPPWLLPLMRVIRTEAPTTVGEAMKLLPAYLPLGVNLPTLAEATEVLRSLGMAR